MTKTWYDGKHHGTAVITLGSTCKRPHFSFPLSPLSPLHGHKDPLWSVSPKKGFGNAKLKHFAFILSS